MWVVRESSSGVVIHIKVAPSSDKDCVCGSDGGYVKVKTRAPPEKGKANKAVMSMFTGLFGDCEMLSGHKSRKKTILIKDTTVDEVREKIRKV